MIVIGKTTTGNYIIEATPDEWHEYRQQFASPSDIASLIGNIRDYRTRTRKTQQELADEVGISRNYLSQIERGEAVNFSISVYQRLAAVVQ